jgi:hypothetical protein
VFSAVPPAGTPGLDMVFIAHPGLRPGLLSVVPFGTQLERVVLTQALKPVPFTLGLC